MRLGYARRVVTEPPSVSRVLDWILGGGAILCGTSAFLACLTFLGLAMWTAAHSPPSTLASILGRWMLGGLGTFVLWIGFVALGAGMEAVLERPLGRSTGTPSLFAWWIALRVGALDAGLTALLARRLAERTGDGLHTALAWWSAALSVSTWMLAKTVLLLLALVTIAFIFD